MTYQEVIEYLYNSLPMYHRVGMAAYKEDIINTEKLMEALDHPERKIKTIHVAGTNGKGSVSHFLASILQNSGYKVGLYTSPHLIDFRERIRINGKMVSEKYVENFVNANKPLFDEVQPSFFEMTVAMAAPPTPMAGRPNQPKIKLGSRMMLMMAPVLWVIME